MRMNLRIFSDNCTILTCTKKAAHSAAFSDLGGIQTHNLLIRSQMLYSVELRGQYFQEDYSVFDVSSAITPANFFSLMRAFFPVRPLR